MKSSKPFDRTIIAKLLLECKTNHQIAEEIGIPIYTLKSRIQVMMKENRVTSRGSLIAVLYKIDKTGK